VPQPITGNGSPLEGMGRVCILIAAPSGLAGVAAGAAAVPEGPPVASAPPAAATVMQDGIRSAGGVKARQPAAVAVAASDGVASCGIASAVPTVLSAARRPAVVVFMSLPSAAMTDQERCTAAPGLDLDGPVSATVVPQW
jgi:hypothetical protein